MVPKPARPEGVSVDIFDCCSGILRTYGKVRGGSVQRPDSLCS